MGYNQHILHEKGAKMPTISSLLNNQKIWEHQIWHAGWCSLTFFLEKPTLSSSLKRHSHFF